MKKVVLFLGLVLLLASCNKKEEGQRIYSQINDVGKIAGTITDANSQQPVTGAMITIKNAADTVYTDPNGNFYIPEVAPGARLVYISKAGYFKDSTAAVVVELKTAVVDLAIVRDTIVPPATFTGKWTGWLTKPTYIAPLLLNVQQFGQDSIKGYLIVYSPGIPQYFPQDTIYIYSGLYLEDPAFKFNVYTDPSCHGFLQGIFVNSDSIRGTFYHYCNAETPVTEPWAAKRQ
jgi:hypothetical protein